MQTVFLQIRQTLIPDLGSKHGPLPPLLVALTFVTGLVDAFSYLVLGHVFVANMTGNVVLMGFALAGAPGFSIGASLAALAAFWCGALAGGRVGFRYANHRGRLLCTTASIQAIVLAFATILAVLSTSPLAIGSEYALLVLLGLAMGVQNASARRLAVPDLTTTVLTLTITGLAADSGLAGGAGEPAGRRLVAVAAMLAGASVGAELVLHAQRVFAPAIALVVLATVSFAAWRLGRANPDWVGADNRA